jgi:hypothetical protein
MILAPSSEDDNQLEEKFFAPCPEHTESRSHQFIYNLYNIILPSIIYRYPKSSLPFRFPDYNCTNHTHTYETVGLFIPSAGAKL